MIGLLSGVKICAHLHLDTRVAHREYRYLVTARLHYSLFEATVNATKHTTLNQSHNMPSDVDLVFPFLVV